MKSLKDYIITEADDKKSDDEVMKPVSDDTKAEITAKDKERADIKFTIWKEPDKQVDWLNTGDKYQKIEYKYINKEKGIEIDFLLGQQNEIWKMWMGKIGACSYDEDPYCSFETKNFGNAMIEALDKIQKILDEIRKDPDNYVQYYKNM